MSKTPKIGRLSHSVLYPWGSFEYTPQRPLGWSSTVALDEVEGCLSYHYPQWTPSFTIGSIPTGLLLWPTRDSLFTPLHISFQGISQHAKLCTPWPRYEGDHKEKLIARCLGDAKRPEAGQDTGVSVSDGFSHITLKDIKRLLLQCIHITEELGDISPQGLAVFFLLLVCVGFSSLINLIKFNSFLDSEHAVKWHFWNSRSAVYRGGFL